MSMSATNVALGRLSFQQHKANIQLQASLSIRVSTLSTGNSKDFEFNPQYLTSENVIVSMGNDLKLRIHVDVEQPIEIVSSDDTSASQIFRSVIENAEFWSQLGLVPSPSMITSDSEGRPTRQFMLELHLKSSEISKAPQSADLQTPVHVALVRLDVVELVLRFSDSTLDSELSNQPHYQGRKQQLQVPQTQLLGKRPTSKQASRIRPQLDHDITVAFLDAALRNSICGHTQPRRGIRVVHWSLANTLNEVAPTIFVTGYTASVIGRTALIPSVSRFLSRFQEQSETFLGKSYSSQSHTEFTSNPEVEHADGSCSDTVFKVRQQVECDLWATMIRRLNDISCARRMKPLSAAEPGKRCKRLLSEPNWSGNEGLPCERKAHPLFDGSLSRHRLNDLEDEDGADRLLFDLYCNANVSSMETSEKKLCSLKGVKVPPGKLQVQQEADEDISLLVTDECLSRFGALARDQNSSHRRVRTLAEEGLDQSPLTLAQSTCRLPVYGNVEYPADEMIGAIWGTGELTQKTFRMHPRERLADTLTSTPRRNDWSVYQTLNPCNQELLECSIRTQRLPGLGESASVGDRQASDTLNENPTHLSSNRPSYPWTTQHNPKPWSFENTKEAMSPTRQEQASLSDMLGNDQLMWHMWQRRASVAPREDDMLEMRNMYELDPDMKLIGGNSNNNQSESVRDDWSFQDPTTRTSSNGGERGVMSANGSMSNGRPLFSKRPSTSSSSSFPSPAPSPSQRTQRKSSVFKRFSWGSRSSTEPEMLDFDMERTSRQVEVKRRKTLEDYEMKDQNSPEEEPEEMLF